jgi:hypothetical protein
VVVLTGKAQFKKQMPPGVVLMRDLVRHINGIARPVLRPDEMQRAAQLIESRRLEPGADTNRLHIRSLKGRHGQVDNAGRRARGFGPRGAGTFVPMRTFIGVVAMVLLLLGGTWLITNIPGFISLGKPRLAAGPVSGAPAAAIASKPPSGAPDSSPIAGSTMPQATAQTTSQPAADRDRRREIESHEAWLNSLYCGYSSESKRCACYDPQGVKVPMEFEQCRALADKTSSPGG